MIKKNQNQTGENTDDQEPLKGLPGIDEVEITDADLLNVTGGTTGICAFLRGCLYSNVRSIGR